jgi:hypothetical protein
MTDERTMPSDVVADDEDVEQATPEEQEAFDAFVLVGLGLIYGGGEVKPGILKLLDEDPTDLKKVLGDNPEFENFNPVVALAGAAVVVVLEIVRKGENIPDAVILHGGKLILEELANVADEAGSHTFSQEELNRAFYIALDLYREAATSEGLLDPTQLKEEFGQIKAADEQGAFGQGPPVDQQPAQPRGGIAP